ncbi:MAG: extracellular solute-binding protein [Acetobacteraceae bacterium]
MSTHSAFNRPLGRRGVLLGAAAAGLAPAIARAQQAAGLEAAANQEGAVSFYTSIDVAVAEKMTAAFTARYPKIQLRVERSGAERILQRLMQENQSEIHAADVVESSDVTSFVDWKQRGWLAPYVPDDVGQYWPKEERDPDGTFAAVRAHLSVVGYNTKQVTAADAPTSLADLLQPKWRMRMVKAHPSYSGTILTATFAVTQALGWDYLEKLAKQRVLQVQSSTEPPKKVVQGERSIMCDGNEYDAFFLREAGEPIEIVYATEGSPLIPGQAGVMKQAPHPNAARLFANFLFSQDCQQLMSDVGGLRSFHPKVVLKPGRKPLSDIKVLRSDPAELAKASAGIKQRYAQVFGV